MLDLEAVDQIDVTGEEMLTIWSERLKLAGIEFFITRPKFKLLDTLKRSGLYEKIGESHFYSKRLKALQTVKRKYGNLIDISHLEEHKPIKLKESENGIDTEK